MPASSAATADFDLNDPAMAMFSSVFAKFQGDVAQEMSDEVVGHSFFSGFFFELTICQLLIPKTLIYAAGQPGSREGGSHLFR